MIDEIKDVVATKLVVVGFNYGTAARCAEHALRTLGEKAPVEELVATAKTFGKRTKIAKVGWPDAGTPRKDHTPFEQQVLRSVVKRGRASAREVGSDVGRTPANGVNKMLLRLVERGWLEVVEVVRNKKIYAVTAVGTEKLKPKGRADVHQ